MKTQFIQNNIRQKVFKNLLPITSNCRMPLFWFQEPILKSSNKSLLKLSVHTEFINSDSIKTVKFKMSLLMILFPYSIKYPCSQVLSGRNKFTPCFWKKQLLNYTEIMNPFLKTVKLFFKLFSVERSEKNIFLLSKLRNKSFQFCNKVFKKMDSLFC